MSVQMVPVSADALLEQLGTWKVDHGKQINGLSLADVWAYAPESAATAARQRPAENATQSQNLLRGYCRARAALDELQALSVRYKIPIQAPARRASGALEVPALHEASHSSLALVSSSPSAMMAMGPSSRSAATAKPPPRTTKGGRCRPVGLAVEAAPVAQCDTTDTGINWLQWIGADLAQRGRAMAIWAVVRIPLMVHLLWILTLCAGLYFISRPKLMVRVGVAVGSKALDIVTSSGVELLQELDEFLIVHANPSTMADVASRSLGFGGPHHPPPVDSSALLRAAAEHASQSVSANATFEEVASASAAFALSEFERHQIDKQTQFGAEHHSAPAGSGLCLGTAMFIAAIKTLRL